jgi:hypothetical protein
VRAEASSLRLRVLLTLTPMALATLGGVVDQYSRLGFTLWRDACRATGVTAGALLLFTLELLPNAVIGGLLGGLIVLAVGLSGRAGGCATRYSLAAHLGCVLGMAAGMLLCALFLPPAWMLVVEPPLAIGLSGWLFHLMRPRLMRASVSPRTRVLPSA